MKNRLLLLFPMTFLILFGTTPQGKAQDRKSTKMHITVTEDDKVTSDTTIELKEGQDPEMIKKALSHMAGGEMHMMHVSKEAHAGKGENKKMVWVSTAGDEDWSAGEGETGLNIDSICEAHKDAKVLVIKDINGKVTVKELDDEAELHLDKESGDFHGMMFVETDDGGETIHIKKSAGGKKIVLISEEGGEDGKYTVTVESDLDKDTCMDKNIRVIVSGDEDMQKIEGTGDKNIEVYVIKKKDDSGEEVKSVQKKVKVEIREDDASVKSGKSGKQKKK